MSHTDRTLERLSFPIQYLEIGESLLRARGQDVERFYQLCGVANAAALHPGQTINGLQFRRALQLFLNVCEPQPAPMVQVLAHFPLTIHGPLGVLALASPTLGEALEAAVEYAPLVMPAFNLRREDHGRAVHVVFERRYDFAPVNELFTEMVMGTFLKIQPFLSAMPASIQLQFTHAPLGAESDYSLGEGVQLRFGASLNQLVFRASDLAIPLLTPSRSSRLLMQAALEQQRLQQGKQSPITSQIKRLLQQALHIGQPLEAAQVAASLTISLRTLSRRLQNENTTLPQLQAEVGVAFASLLLLESDHSIAEIARQAGFSSATGFSRAFKRQQGTTPSQFRGS